MEVGMVNMQNSINTDSVEETLEMTVIGFENGEFMCDDCSQRIKIPVCINDEDGVPVTVYASAPRHNLQQWTIKKVYCDDCDGEINYPSPQAAEVIAEGQLVRDADHEPAYFLNPTITETSPKGQGTI